MHSILHLHRIIYRLGNGIGRKVFINFTNKELVPTDDYTVSDYLSDVTKLALTFNPLTLTQSLPTDMANIAQSLFASGVTKFLDAQNRPILYGTNGNNALSENFSASEAPLLYPYKSNGVVLIGGAGDDVLAGGNHADKLIGGEGYSQYFVGDKDVIIDINNGVSENKSEGAVIFDNIELIGGSKRPGELDYQDNRGNHFSLSGATLTVTNGDKVLKIENFINHDLGINLEEFFVQTTNLPGSTLPTTPSPPAVKPIQTPPPPVPGKIWEPIIVVSPDGTSFSDSGRRVLVWPGSAPHYETPEGIPIKKEGDQWVPKNPPNGNNPATPNNPNAQPTGPVKPLTEPTPIPWTGPRTDPNAPYTSPADKNGNGIPDIHESKIDPKDVKVPWDNSKNWQPRRDPLTLDLDGDGIETVGVSSTNPILFDHDGDGIKNGTGWVASDDGMLVLDRNGNGSIDSGRELFGDSTIKSNGQVATNGFNALADIDSNADGVVNSTDTQYANLRIWRDLNQDGTSQTGELFTLASQNITAINVASTLNSQTLANGNQVADLGTYTKTDGSTGVLGEVTGNLADINLADDTFHRSFPNVLDTTSVASLPDMQGSGAVRDLREAATQSATLQNLLTQYSAATTRAAQMALIDQLLGAWADTSGYAETYADRVAGLEYDDGMVTLPYNVSYEAFGSITNATFLTGTYTSSGGGGGGGTIGLETVTPEFQALIDSWNQKIHVLEAFNGNYFFGLPTNPNDGARNGITFEAANPNGGGGGIVTSIPIRIRYDQAQLDLLQQSYDALKSSIYDALVLQTRFKPLLDQINLVIDSSGIHLDFTQVTNSFNQKISENAEAGLLELIDFNAATKAMLSGTGWQGWGQMAQQLQTTQSTAINEALKLNGVMVAGMEGYLANGTTADDVIIGNGEIDSLYGSEGNDILIGLAGDDILDGGNGNDTFVIGNNVGNDSIHDYGAVTETDVVQLAINSTDVTALLREGDNLVIQSGVNNRLTVAYQLSYYHEAYGYGIEQLQFSDGVVWTQADIKARFITNGSAGDDNISGLSGSTNRIYGFEGNDILTGGDGNDILSGGLGDDSLSGSEGNDTLNGDNGNDGLDGGNGSDTFVIGANAGADVIYDYGNITDTDIVQLGINSTDITALLRVGDNLVIQSGVSDQVTISYQLSNYHDAYGYGVEQLQFSDGVTWTHADIIARVNTNGSTGDDNLSGIGNYTNRMYGFEGNDTLSGGSIEDTIEGGAGDDTLSGGEGNDTLVGGLGNDSLDGGNGNDTFVIAVGAGTDTLFDGGGVTETDIVQLGFNSTDVTALLRDGDNLIIRSGAGDQLTITYQLSNYHDAYGYGIEQLQFSDGVTWTHADIITRVNSNGTSGDDTIVGIGSYTNRMYGLDGNDSLTGGSLDDVIEGGNGNDSLGGSDGNDIILGGAGDDAMDGGNGNDTFIIGTGAGVDVIYDYGSITETDVVQLAIKSTDITALLRQGDNLVIQSGTSDQLIITSQLSYYHEAYGYGIEQLQFSDGVVWTQADIIANVNANGTTGDDNLNGLTNSGNRMYGLAGNDILTGGNVEDMLDGGTGDDTLSGGEGNDTLVGAVGNDSLDGGNGNDTFVIGTGAGVDVISDYGAATDTDIVQLAIKSTDITAMLRDGDNLIIQSGTGDQFTIVYQMHQAYHDGYGYGVEQLQFSDGVTWTQADITARVITNGTSGDDSLSGVTGYTNRMYGLDGNDALTGGAIEDTINGGAGNDSLSGLDGNDIIIGGAGNDSLDGGNGNDTFVIGTGAGVDSLFDGGAATETDIVQLAIKSTDITALLREGDNLVIQSGAGDQLTIAYQMNQAYHEGYGWGVEQLQFSDGVMWTHADIVARVNTNGTSSDDNLFGISGYTNRMYGLDGNDSLTGGSLEDVINGGAGNDTLSGLDGNDTIIGGIGNDSLDGGNGNDTFVIGAGAGVDTLFDGGAATETDIVQLGFNSTDVTALLRDGDNLIIQSGAGNQLTIAYQMNPTYHEGYGYGVEQFQFSDGVTWTQADILARVVDNLVLVGTTGNDTLMGNTGNDSIDGGAGADTMQGGKGDDTYFVDNTGDVVTEILNEGTDTVQSAITYTLTTNVENLTLTGTAAINGSGNTLNNVLTGNGANNTLNGGTGADKMAGGLGNDTYVVDNIADVVTENAAEGTDTVQSSITYTLGAELENLTLTGSTAINGTGNDLNNSVVGNTVANTLTGGLGNDTLNGGAGADTLIGGVGNDIYVLDSLSDVVTENAGEGTDTVQTAVTLTNMTLAANVENLTLTGTAAINGWGNSLNNTLTGNAASNVLYGAAGNDTLNGGAGADTLVGGLGNDIYVLDNVADIVTESTNEGTDTVQTAITLGNLAANVENITLTGTAAVNATGNDLNNVLTGNSAVNTLNGGLGNDTLNGAAGADTMVGGAGNDIFVVDNAGDVVTEIANEGTDTIQSSITLTALAANVEILNLTGTTAINGVGNSLSNFLKGNTAANSLTDSLGGNDILQGLAGLDILNDTAGNNLFDGGLDADTITAGAGKDLIIGGKGNDTITTGAGYDVISFNKGDEADIINASTGADNTISLGGAFAYSDLSLTKTGNDLIVKMGTTDQLTLKDWYLGTTNKSVVNLQVIAEAVTGFALGGADTLRNNKVENFNFANLVATYDAAGATANWQLTDARLTTHLLAGSDTAAIGGDLAYQYGRNSNLTGVGLLAAQNVINATSFGQTAQTLNNPSVWSAEVVKLG